MGDLGGHRRLAGAGGAADQDDNRQIELTKRLQATKVKNSLAVLVLREHGGSDVVQAVGADRLVLVVLQELRLDQPRKLVRTNGLDSGAHERPGHQALRVREPDVLGDERLGRAAVGVHRATGL